MKKILFTIFTLLSLVIVQGARAQNIDAAIAGLKAGDAARIAKNTAENVVLTIADKSNTYSSAQAQQILKEFFTKNPVKGFDLKHKGSSPNGNYCIGTMSTSTGSYRVNMFMKKNGAGEVIRELRFQLIE